MHESTQRLLCRAAFLLVCVAPTFCTLAWIAYRHSDMATAAVEHRLSERIGLRCHLDRYYNPRPDLHVFEGLRLDVAGAPAVTIGLLKAERIDQVWHLTGPSSEVVWAHRRRLWETLQESAGGTSAWPGQPVRLAIGEIIFSDLDLPTMGRFQLRSEASPQGSGFPEIHAQAQLTKESNSPAVRLNIARGAEPSGPLEVQFQTDDQGVPVTYLARLSPHLEGLGSQALYQGKITWRGTSPAPAVELQGAFRQVDLQPLLTQTYQIHATGLVDLHLEQARLRGENITQAHGWITGRDGQIAGHFAAQAAQSLGLQTARPTAELGQDLVAYHQLALEFLLERGELSLAGYCDDMPHGTLLAGLNRPILGQPQLQRQPATNLVSALFPPESHTNGPTVPATRRSVILARWLSPEPVVEMAEAETVGERR
ncbi:MAG: hypothetical protein WD045_01780 [Pirellulaceae bacterium]